MDIPWFYFKTFVPIFFNSELDFLEMNQVDKKTSDAFVWWYSIARLIFRRCEEGTSVSFVKKFGALAVFYSLESLSIGPSSVERFSQSWTRCSSLKCAKASLFQYVQHFPVQSWMIDYFSCSNHFTVKRLFFGSSFVRSRQTKVFQRWTPQVTSKFPGRPCATGEWRALSGSWSRWSMPRTLFPVTFWSRIVLTSVRVNYINF